MRGLVEQTWGVVTKELRQWRRDPQAAAAPMVLPLVLMALSAILFGQSGDSWPVGLANQSPGPEAQQLTRTFEAARSQLSPYFQLVTRDAEQAQRLVEEGRLHMAVVIPEDFDRRLATGDHVAVQLSTFNINTDVTKNVRLRLDHVIQQRLVNKGEAAVVATRSAHGRTMSSAAPSSLEVAWYWRFSWAPSSTLPSWQLASGSGAPHRRSNSPLTPRRP